MVHLLQAYSNPAPGVVTPEELLFRSRPHEHQGATRETLRRARLLRADETAALVARYIVVRNIRAVAREFKISRTTASRVLTEHGIDTSRGMTGAQIAIAVELYERGRASAAIGSRLGFDNHTILKAVRARGVTIRPVVSGRREGQSVSIT